MRIQGILAMAGFLAAAGCGQEAVTPAAEIDTSTLPADDVVYGLHQVMTSDGVRSAVLDADTALAREQAEEFDLRGVHLEFFNDDGSAAGTLTSRTGVYGLDTRMFVARGNVVLITEGESGPRRLETDELHYNVNSGELWSDKPFTLTENGDVTHGDSFRANARNDFRSARGLRTEGGALDGGSELSF